MTVRSSEERVEFMLFAKRIQNTNNDKDNRCNVLSVASQPCSNVRIDKKHLEQASPQASDRTFEQLGQL